MNSYYIYDTKNGYFNAAALFGKKGKKYLGGRDSFIVLVPCCFPPFLGPFFQKGRRRWCALFLKKSPKRAISTNGFIPSGETYQWFL
jgi:hypothetical protein